MINLKRMLFGIPRLSLDDIYELVHQKHAVLLDVRTHDEYAKGHVMGSVNIPYDELANRSGELPQDKPIVLYCQSGARSTVAEDILRDKGFRDLHNAKEWLWVSQALDRVKGKK